MNAPSALRAMGPAAAATAVALPALAIGLAAGCYLGGVAVTDDPHLIARTIVRAAILIDWIYIAGVTYSLARPCRRRP